MLDTLTIEHFRDRIGTTFAAMAQERRLSLTLRRVDALPRPLADKGLEPFSLEFTDQAHDYVPQQTVAVADPDLGSFKLFIVPLGPIADGMRYEAIFT